MHGCSESGRWPAMSNQGTLPAIVSWVRAFQAIVFHELSEIPIHTSYHTIISNVFCHIFLSSLGLVQIARANTDNSWNEHWSGSPRMKQAVMYKCGVEVLKSEENELKTVKIFSRQFFIADGPDPMVKISQQFNNRAVDHVYSFRLAKRSTI